MKIIIETFPFEYFLRSQQPLIVLGNELRSLLVDLDLTDANYNG